jgi:hypothetical protein
LKSDPILNETTVHLSGREALKTRMRYIVQLRNLRSGLDADTDGDDDTNYDDDEKMSSSSLDNDDDDDDDDEDDEDKVDNKGKKYKSHKSTPKSKKRKLSSLERKRTEGKKKNKSVLKKTSKMKKREELENVEIETKISECDEQKCDFIENCTLNKPAATIAIINEHKKEKILVFINNIKMSSVLSKRFDEEKISYLCLSGSGGRIDNILKQFKDGDIDVLILNGNRTGSGLNIQMADVQIIYDAKNEQAVTQANGRSQRHGRDKNAAALQVYVLTHKKF